MTPRERVERALSGEHADMVPFTIYEKMIPQCRAERDLRNRGLCIVKRTGVFTTHTPNVEVRQHTYRDNGRQLTETRYETPVGSLSTMTEPAGFTAWRHKWLFGSPDDYKALLFLIQDEVYSPSYAAFAAAETAAGGDAIYRATFGLEPLQMLISSSYFSTESFCFEWMERRDELLKLYRALVEKRRQVYELVARSPASHANYGGNVVPEIIGLDTFKEFYVPHYNEAAEIMHRHGKFIGCHFDANCRLLAAAIAETGLDYIEAFTPAPNSDMTLAEARQAWPHKVLWLNFPSSVHLHPGAAVTATTLELLNQVPSVDGLLIGITENVPENRWQDSCRAIMDGIEQHARVRSDLYR